MKFKSMQIVLPLLFALSTAKAQDVVIFGGDSTDSKDRSVKAFNEGNMRKKPLNRLKEIGDGDDQLGIVPHGGLWKSYDGSTQAENSVLSYFAGTGPATYDGSVIDLLAGDAEMFDVDESTRAENSVSSYVAAVESVTQDGAGIDLVAVDTEIFEVDGDNRVVVYRDRYFDRLTNWPQSTDDWGLKVFNRTNPYTHRTDHVPLDAQTFNSLMLFRQETGGKTEVTQDQPLMLADFINATACKYDARLLVEIETVAVAELATAVIRNGVCPNGTAYAGHQYTERAYVKMDVMSTMPDSIINSSVADLYLLQEVTDYYGSDLSYYFEVNESQFDSECSVSRNINAFCAFVSPLSTRAVYPVNLLGGMLRNAPSAIGVVLNYPAPFSTYEATDAMGLIARSIEDTYTGLLPSAGSLIELVSVASRPDDAIISQTYGGWTGNTGEGSAGPAPLADRCFMYNYDREVAAELSFFSPDVFNKQNEFARRSGFNRIIVDAFQFNNVIYDDLQVEVQLLCGDITIPTKFEVHERAAESDNMHHYRYLTDSYTLFYYLDVIQGATEIEDTFEP